MMFSEEGMINHLLINLHLAACGGMYTGAKGLAWLSAPGAEMGSVETENMSVILKDVCIEPKMQPGLQSEI